jgi:hypothetical protein
MTQRAAAAKPKASEKITEKVQVRFEQNRDFNEPYQALIFAPTRLRKDVHKMH